MRKLSLALLLLVPAVSAQDKPHAYLGVRVAPLDGPHDFAVPKGVKNGVVLTVVEKGSAAERAGLRTGDIVVYFDGKSVESLEGLVSAVMARKPGDRVTYKVLRGTGSIEGTLRLGERPREVEASKEPETKRAEPSDKPARPEGGLDKRLDRVAEQIEEMRQRLGGKPREKVAAVPGNLVGWMEREEKFIAAARKHGDENGVRYHEARMSMLREMRQAGFRAPAGRLARIERKLDAIIKLLQKRK